MTHLRHFDPSILLHTAWNYFTKYWSILKLAGWQTKAINDLESLLCEDSETKQCTSDHSSFNSAHDPNEINYKLDPSRPFESITTSFLSSNVRPPKKKLAVPTASPVLFKPYLRRAPFTLNARLNTSIVKLYPCCNIKNLASTSQTKDASTTLTN